MLFPPYFFSRTFLLLLSSFFFSLSFHSRSHYSFAPRDVFPNSMASLTRYIIITANARSVWLDYQSIFLSFVFRCVLMRTKHVIDTDRRNVLFVGRCLFGFFNTFLKQFLWFALCALHSFTLKAIASSFCFSFHFDCTYENRYFVFPSVKFFKRKISKEK